MAYKPTDIFFFPLVEGNVRTTGGSLSLGVGELAFVNINSTTKAEGAKVLSDFSPLPANAKLAIRMGEPNDYVSRSEDNKAISTIPFTLNDVVNVYVDAPQKKGVSVDDFVIGFNGTDGSEIELDNSENEVINVTLSDGPISMIGLPDNKFTFNINLTAPINGVKNDTLAPGDTGYDALENDSWTMEEIMENAFKELKGRTFPGNIPITDYVDIMLVNSTNPATLPGTAVTTYNLNLQDQGFQSDLGKVQAQYPGLDVKRVEWNDGKTTYAVMGTALPAAYQAKSDFLLKGCEACPAGYAELAQGFVYEVVIEDPTDQTATVQAIPGATAGTAVLNDTEGDTNTYSVVTDDALTEAEITAFIGANAGTQAINLVAKDVADLCESAAPASVAWTAGEVCNTTTETYQIRLKDTDCGESRLEELQLAYSDLIITEVAGTDTACQRTYETTVNTSFVCEDCDPIFRDVFTSEAPESYDGIAWTTPEKEYDGTAKLGIRIRGKRSTLSGSELLRDNMPFFDDSVSISLAGGYQMYTNESYLAGTNERFTVKYFSRKSPAHNLGGNLRKYEEEAQMHFRGRGRHVGNNFGKIVTGQETRLKGLQNYIVYSVTIAPHKYASNFQQGQTGAFTYHFPVEIGKQQALEDVLNKLAAATGNVQVQAVSK